MFLGESISNYFYILSILPPYNGLCINPLKYGYVVPFREILLPEIQRNKYFVNYYGIVYNLQTNNFLKGGLDSSGYKQVTLCGINKQNNILIHKLVMSAFNCNKYPIGISDITIDHIDGNKLNNDFRNLRYLDRNENSKNHKSTVSKISKNLVLAIAKEYHNGSMMNYSDMAQKYSLSKSFIYHFMHNRIKSFNDIYNDFDIINSKKVLYEKGVM